VAVTLASGLHVFSSTRQGSGSDWERDETFRPSPAVSVRTGLWSRRRKYVFFLQFTICLFNSSASSGPPQLPFSSVQRFIKCIHTTQVITRDAPAGLVDQKIVTLWHILAWCYWSIVERHGKKLPAESSRNIEAPWSGVQCFGLPNKQDRSSYHPVNV